MIPPFGPGGNLPPGVHDPTWLEVAERFGGTPRRVELLAGLRRALVALREAGCRVVVVDLRRLDPTLFDFDLGRRAQTRKYGGELFPASFVTGPQGELAIDVRDLE